MIALRPTALIPFSLVLAFGLVACGSSSGKPNGSAGSNGSTGGSSGSGGSGGSSGSGGANGSGGTTVTGTCGDVPPCLANLITGCTPSGTCIEQMSGSITTGIRNNSCYSNGVKVALSESFDSTFTNATVAVTYSKSGTTCFSEEGAFSLGAGGSSGSTTFNIKNGSGAVVATLTEDAVTGGTTVTCGGQTYTVTDMGSCMMTMPSVGGTGGMAGSSCTQGSCP